MIADDCYIKLIVYRAKLSSHQSISIWYNNVSGLDSHGRPSLSADVAAAAAAAAANERPLWDILLVGAHSQAGPWSRGSVQ